MTKILLQFPLNRILLEVGDARIVTLMKSSIKPILIAGRNCNTLTSLQVLNLVHKIMNTGEWKFIVKIPITLIIITSLQQHQSCAVVGVCIRKEFSYIARTTLCPAFIIVPWYSYYYFFSKTPLLAKAIHPGGQETDGILLRVRDCAGGNPNLPPRAWKVCCSERPCFSSAPQDTELCFWSMFFWRFRSHSSITVNFLTA